LTSQIHQLKSLSHWTSTVKENRRPGGAADHKAPGTTSTLVQQRTEEKLGNEQRRYAHSTTSEGENATNEIRGRLTIKPGRENNRTRRQDWRAAKAGRELYKCKQQTFSQQCILSFITCKINLNVRPLWGPKKKT